MSTWRTSRFEWFIDGIEVEVRHCLWCVRLPMARSKARIGASICHPRTEATKWEWLRKRRSLKCFFFVRSTFCSSSSATITTTFSPSPLAPQPTLHPHELQTWGQRRTFPGQVIVESREEALDTAGSCSRRDTIWAGGSRLADGRVGAACVWRAAGEWEGCCFRLGGDGGCSMRKSMPSPRPWRFWTGDRRVVDGTRSLWIPHWQ